jgi:hypothetical protein
MTRLKDAHRGQRAVVVFGGPSLIDSGFDFKALRAREFVLFLDTKALTPHFLAAGARPDYFLMLYPEKAKDNALQAFVFRSFLAGRRIRPLLKAQYQSTVDDMTRRFDECFEHRPGKAVHKRLRWKPNVYLDDSPYDLLRRLPGVPVIANRKLLDRYFPSFDRSSGLFLFENDPKPADFSLERYYEVGESDGAVLLPTFKHLLNSAAIGLFPLLRYMGFREVYCLGMDMSMLGTMEYAAPYTFKSMWHYRWFFLRSQRAFNADFRQNRPYYFRPKSEFDDLRALAASPQLRLVRVYDPHPYAAPLEGMASVSTSDLLRM